MTNLDALQLLHGIQKKLLTVNQQLNLLSIKESHMPIDPTIAAVIKDMDDATNVIAARIAKFIDAANQAGTVSAADVVAALQPEVVRLKGLGADPASPVPVV